MTLPTHPRAHSNTHSRPPTKRTTKAHGHGEAARFRLTRPAHAAEVHTRRAPLAGKAFRPRGGGRQTESARPCRRVGDCLGAV